MSESLEEQTTNPSIDSDDDALDQFDESESVQRSDEQDASPVEVTITSVIEAVLFAADEPITPQKLAEITGAAGVKDIREQIQQLNEKYDQMNCAFRIEAIAGGYQMLTLPAYNTWLQKLIKVRSETKLSPAALETLAIISYKQPILRVDIEAIRGVAAGEMVRQLIDKGLVKIVGRAEVPGRPLLYGTTRKFLQTFGLNSLKDLPSNEDLKKPE
jgi:segregation and condensation protein B